MAKIKPEDLRKGNCVINSDHGKVLISEIKMSEMQSHEYMSSLSPTPLSTNKPSFLGHCYIEDLKPIKITKKILLNVCGAIEVKKDTYNINGMQIHTNYKGKFIEYVHRIELKGLHHLQNLYYFTRQKELTLNI